MFSVIMHVNDYWDSPWVQGNHGGPENMKTIFICVWSHDELPLLLHLSKPSLFKSVLPPLICPQGVNCVKLWLILMLIMLYYERVGLVCWRQESCVECWHIMRRLITLQSVIQSQYCVQMFISGVTWLIRFCDMRFWKHSPWVLGVREALVVLEHRWSATD